MLPETPHGLGKGWLWLARPGLGVAPVAGNLVTDIWSLRLVFSALDGAVFENSFGEFLGEVRKMDSLPSWIPQVFTEHLQYAAKWPGISKGGRASPALGAGWGTWGQFLTFLALGFFCKMRRQCLPVLCIKQNSSMVHRTVSSTYSKWDAIQSPSMSLDPPLPSQIIS